MSVLTEPRCQPHPVPVEEARTAPDEYTVITLCGSMRFRDELERLEAELTLAGHVVLAPAALAPSRRLSAQERARLGRVHVSFLEPPTADHCANS